MSAQGFGNRDRPSCNTTLRTWQAMSLQTPLQGCTDCKYTVGAGRLRVVVAVTSVASPTYLNNANEKSLPYSDSRFIHRCSPSRANPITVDAKADVHPISPLIYGTAFASTQQLALLNAPLNRSGGNLTSSYNWKLNASNHGNDYFFESIAEDSAVPAETADMFVTQSKAAGAQPMLTIPMLDWVANLGPGRDKLGSFSVAKYGPQEKTDQWMPDSGNGNKPDGKPIIGNDPSDASTPNSPTFQKGFVQHLIQRFGTAQKGGLRYYVLDNEPALWNSTHRDVNPKALTMHDLVAKTLTYSAMIKAVDPGALVVGPEEWGWPAYLYSAADSELAPGLGWDNDKFPERQQMGGMDALPWYLDQMRRSEQKTGKRPLDVFTVHVYPQGGEFGDDVSTSIQQLRNRSTRSLWDLNYVDESWIKDKVYAIPRMKKWVAQYYPSTPVGITEYNWGAENHINGATAQADIYGIFGREGLDMATRWTTPDAKTPTFKAMQMYRNYDGQKSGFGDTSVRATTPTPNDLSAFAAVRKSDGALTVMVVNKKLPTGSSRTSQIALAVQNFKAGATAQIWQLTSENVIKHMADAQSQGGKLNLTLPTQSVTLLILPIAK